MTRTLLLLSAVCLTPPALHGAILTGTDSVSFDEFGAAVSIAGGTAVVGAPSHNQAGIADRGAVYLFRSLSNATGTRTQNAKLTASSGAAGDAFGTAAACDSTLTAVVGAPFTAVGGSARRGAAYVFRGLNSSSGTVTQNVLLTSTSGTPDDLFGSAVALDSNIGVIGAPGLDFFGNTARGAAYVFRSLNTATGGINENTILYALDGAPGDRFGTAVACKGGLAVVGAPEADNGAVQTQGSAYLFRDLATAGALVGQSVKFLASDGAASDRFGTSVALAPDTGSSDTLAVIGAPDDNNGSDSDVGSAYFFRVTAAATGTLNQTVKLAAAGGQPLDRLGASVSISGPNVLAGAPAAERAGYACLFLNPAGSGTINETVRIQANAGTLDDGFGKSVSITDDEMAFGMFKGNGPAVISGKAFTASVAALTTLNTASATRTIEGLSFRSRTDWIIGDTVDNMTVTLAADATADVSAAGKVIAIGRNTSSTGNRLIVDGILANALTVNVGNGSNAGNHLTVNGSYTAAVTNLRAGSILSGDGMIAGAVAATGSVRPGNNNLATLGVAGDFTWHAGDAWQFGLAAANASDRLSISGAGSDFLKGTGTAARTFDFGGSTQTGTFTLVQWTGNTTFTAPDFAATNLGAGLTAVFSIVGKTLTATVSSLTPLEAWRQTHFGSPLNSGNGADTNDHDRDGVTNLLEYAFGTNPTSAASRHFPEVGPPGPVLTIRFTPQVVSGLTYNVQYSTNLTTWTDNIQNGLTPGVERTATSTFTAARRYLRLTVSY